MSNVNSEHDSSSSDIPDNPLDEAFYWYGQAAQDIGLTEKDRLYWFHRSTVALSHALVWSVKTSHEAHEWALKISQERQEAALGNIQLQSTQFRAKLDEQAAKQKYSAEQFLAEFKRQADAIHKELNIADESRIFFDTLEKVLNNHANRINETLKDHLARYQKLTDEFVIDVRKSVGDLPNDLAKAVRLRLRDNDFIADKVLSDLSENISKKLSVGVYGIILGSVKNYAAGMMATLAVVFMVGIMVGYSLSPTSSLQAQARPVPHGLVPW